MNKLICPVCGVYTSFSPVQVIGKGVLLGYSSEKETRWGDVQISAIVPQEYVYGEDMYAILVCRACNEFFVAKSEKYSHPDSPNWSAVYPIQHKTVAEEIPEPIKSQFEEANLCFVIGAYIGCLLVCRTVLIALQREQGVSNLQELKDKGIISDMLFKQANQVRVWANLIGHEDICKPITKEDSE